MAEYDGTFPLACSIYVLAPYLYISSQERCMGISLAFSGYDGMCRSMVEYDGIVPLSYSIYVHALYIYISSQERCMRI